MAYPFAALVGQEPLKLALLLCAINPGIGGILIQGDKGTAKSTAARGLAELMPSLQRVAQSRYNASPEELLECCEACQLNPDSFEVVPVPFVTLPLGATEDRVLGHLDLESVLNEKRKKLQPGLLATAHRGILYIDEVNLLSDHLVDVLLDVAAMGVNTVQRDGLSISHPSRFMLIGTMNPEEGNLRPQFLDRFGLMVDVQAPTDVNERTEVIRRRIAYETNPKAFIDTWAAEQTNLTQQIERARQLLPSVAMPEGLLTLISQLCTQLNVSSLRADIVLYKTALTLAAYHNRTTVTADDVKQAAELVLPHRRRKKPFEPNHWNNSELDELMNQLPPPPEETGNNDTRENNPADSTDSDSSEEVFDSAPVASFPSLQVEDFRMNASAGRRSVTENSNRGFVKQTIANAQTKDLAIQASIQQAIIRNPDHFSLQKEDLQANVRSGKTGHLIVFVVDASGSMAASRRMEAVKGSVLSLLTDAYQRRDTVAVIAFRGVEAQLVLEPTQSVERAETALRALPTGGRTPLPQALQLAQDLLNQRKENPLLIILSDGKANVPLPGGGDAWQQSLEIAQSLRQVPTLVLDTDTDYLRLGKASELAAALGADCVSLEALSAETLTRTIVKQLQ
ncbi:magnesium chelatase subunit D family protein [Siphonobacter sp. SORGH_AS_0500]|uniref:magnesium chelatase subunit D family protein n=1 Tax=Siphonobacter sp. SORGH_AS_0500 TaxID=1864824 RepID=UPI002855FC2E|nr:magnesium chelatase subunit D family protein [Siphonobacter sp. SORGH_AS_0500]MDR6197849.1 magnesium chelatase subunit D [Siphonobacter sp. SORGH_AS_0500]